MKKTVLASSIAAAVFGLASVGSATAAEYFAINPKGIGQMLFVPYFTAQAENATLLNIVNTDVTNGKAVKIRFRSAANSDDIFDFQLFLSPGDVWAANISQNAAGLPVLTTSDTSCTKPAGISGRTFVTERLGPSAGGVNTPWTSAVKAANTREGYIEIITMGDVPPTVAGAANGLFTATKHTSAGGAPSCSGTNWTTLDNLERLTAAAGNGLATTAGGLMANWTIINTVTSATWAGEAVALQLLDDATTPPTNVNLAVNYFSQTNVALTGAPSSSTTDADYGDIMIWEDARTSDPLFRRTATWRWNTTNLAYEHDATGTNLYLVQPQVSARRYDLPDMSTPSTGAWSARGQAVKISEALATTNFINEYLTDTSVLAKTDWVFSMPTRRYSIAMNYDAKSSNDGGRRFVDLTVATPAAGTAASAIYTLNAAGDKIVPPATLDNDFPYFPASITSVNGDLICVKNVAVTRYNREEVTETSTTPTVISPQSIPPDNLFCGETSVLTINNAGAATSGALKASLATRDITFSSSSLQTAGWASLDFYKANGTTVHNLPVMGFAAVRAESGRSNGQSFGAAWAHRTR